MVLTELELLKRLRHTLDDAEQIVWTDDFLIRSLRRGAEEYFRRVPLLFGSTPILPDRDGVFRWPEEFVGFFYGVNADSEPVTPATPRKLLQYPGLEGATKFVVDHGNHTYTPYPAAVGTEDVEYFQFDPEYGILLNRDGGEELELIYDINGDAYLLLLGFFQADTEYGIVETVEFDEDIYWNTPYGIVATVARGEAAGVLKYHRKDVDAWTLDDPRPVIFYAAMLALQAETDRKNPDTAAMYSQLFNRCVAMNAHRNVRSVRTQPNGVFF